MARKSTSRAARWADAISRARTAFDELSSALGDLNDIKSEYEEWQGKLPDNLRNSALGEKLDAVVNIDFESDLNSVESVLDEAEGIDLPQGFGRD